MSENLTIARPYAEAVYAVAEEGNSIDKWESMLEAVSTACKDEFFLSVLKNSSNPEKASAELLTLLDELLDDQGKNFVRLLCENNRFNVSPEIYEEFRRIREKKEKKLTVNLIAAREYSEVEVNSLKKKLADKYQAIIQINQSLDPSLKGGLILKIGDEVIDASVKTNLKILSSSLR